MASSRKRESSTSSAPPPEPVKEEGEVVQAVVVPARVFFSEHLSSVLNALTTVGSSKLIDFTIECLRRNGVENILVYCSSEDKQLISYLRKTNSNAAKNVEILTMQDGFSLGDALRDLHTREKICSKNFLLLPSNLIMTIDVSDCFTKHQQRSAMDKNSVMTMVFRDCPPVANDNRRSCVVFDPTNYRIRHFQRLRLDCDLQIDLERLTNKSLDAIVIRTDFIDPELCVCSSHVLDLFTDNFDYQTRDHLAKGLLENEDIMGYTFYAHLVHDGFVDAVNTVNDVHRVNMAVLKRMAYPLVPDLFQNEESFTHGRHNVYVSRGARLARGAILGKNTLVRQSSDISEGCRLEQTVIGRGCIVGQFSDLRDCVVGDSCAIGTNCRLAKCVLTDEVRVGDGVHLTRCVLTAGVVLEAGAQRTDVFLWMDAAAGLSELELRSLLDEDDESGENAVGDDYSERACLNDCIETLQRVTNGEDEAVSVILLELNGLKNTYQMSIHQVNRLLARAIVAIAERAWSRQGSLFAALKQTVDPLVPILARYFNPRQGGREFQLDCLRALAALAADDEPLRKALAKLLHLLYESDVLEEDAILEWSKSRDADFVGAGEVDHHHKVQLVRQDIAPFVQWLVEADEDEDDD